MDHHRLIKGLKLIFGLFLLVFNSSCSTHIEAAAHIPPRTILQSSLKPMTVTILAEQFLEWQKGYTVQIRDQQQGLLVTEWTSENPNDRHRITLRVAEDPIGSLLSAHIVHQILNGAQWADIPSSGLEESQLLTELDGYLKNSPAGRKN